MRPRHIAGVGLLGTAGVVAATRLAHAREKEDVGFAKSSDRAGEVTVYSDDENVRVSVWNSAEYLTVEIIVWKDSRAETVKDKDGVVHGDTSALDLDLDGDAKPTPGVDRVYR